MVWSIQNYTSTVNFLQVKLREHCGKGVERFEVSEKLDVCNTGCVKYKLVHFSFDREATPVKLQEYDYLNKT